MTLSLSTFLIGLILLLQAPPAESAAEPEANWYRGNTHTHTLWSDGDAPPEHAVKWYVDNDYDFLVLSDHNLMQQGEKWFKVEEGGRLTPSKVAEVETDFGTEWVKTRESEGATEMRLRTLDELKAHFDKPDAFLLIPGEEVTDKYRLAQVHINAINLESSIDPQHGDSVQETIQNNLDAIQAHGKATGRAVLGHLNHPNFQKSLGATNLANMKGEHFFEVYNGHRSVQNEQIGDRPSTETLWDRALTMRLRDGAGDGELLYGLATDDAHDHYAADAVSVPGRGWLMVRAENLDADSIVSAMKRGDFYAFKRGRTRGDHLRRQDARDSDQGGAGRRLRDGVPRDQRRQGRRRHAGPDALHHQHEPRDLHPRRRRTLRTRPDQEHPTPPAPIRGRRLRDGVGPAGEAMTRGGSPPRSGNRRSSNRQCMNDCLVLSSRRCG